MDKNIYKLRDLLSSMKITLNKLLKIENEKSTVLEKGSVEELDEIIVKEQALIMECSAFEKERMEICSKLNAKSVSELYDLYPESKEIVGHVHEEMIETVNNIKKISAVNMQLLDTKLKLVKFITSQLGSKSEYATYDKKAHLN
jgi:hypothetical protein